jgi:hypothetical protein
MQAKCQLVIGSQSSKTTRTRLLQINASEESVRRLSTAGDRLREAIFEQQCSSAPRRGAGSRAQPYSATARPWRPLPEAKVAVAASVSPDAIVSMSRRNSLRLAAVHHAIDQPHSLSLFSSNRTPGLHRVRQRVSRSLQDLHLTCGRHRPAPGVSDKPRVRAGNGYSNTSSSSPAYSALHARQTESLSARNCRQQDR